MVYIENFVLWRLMPVLDGGSQNSYTIIISIRSISQLGTYGCDVHVRVQCVCMDVTFAYVCNGYICMQ